VISRISVSLKLLLIFGLDMVTVVFLGYSLAEEKYLAIDFARKEVVGTAYVAEARDTFTVMIGYAQAVRRGDRAAVDTARRSLDGRLTAMAQADAAFGAGLDSAELAVEMEGQGRVLLAAGPEELERALTRSIATTRALVSRIGDQSNLILDPDLDSYYAMSLTILRFPELADLLSQAATHIHMVGQQGSISASQRVDLLILEGRLINAIKDVRNDLSAGYRGNADGSLSEALEPGFGRLLPAFDTLMAELRATVLAPQAHGVDTRNLEERLSGTLTAAHAAWIDTTVELDRLLKKRIDGLFERMFQHFAYAAALLAVILFLVLLVARRIDQPIRHLAEVAEQVRQTNDYSLRAKVKARDEIGRLAEAFNTMLERLHDENLREQELAARARAAEAQRDLIEAIPTPLMVTHQVDGALLHVNHPAAALLGLEADAEGVLPQGHDLLDGADRERLLATLDREGAVNEFEARVSPRGGTTFWALVSARFLSYQGEPALLTTITPIQELKTAQDQLVQSEKMAALGQLVAGIAHEINTPLGAIKSSIGSIVRNLSDTMDSLPRIVRLLPEEDDRLFKDLLARAAAGDKTLSTREAREARKALTQELERMAVPDARHVGSALVDMGITGAVEPFRELFANPHRTLMLDTALKLSQMETGARNISMATDRAAKIVFALKNFARFDHRDEKVEASLRDGLETVITLYHNQIKQGVELIREYQDVPSFPCYPDELNQVWTNLIHNGIQAMDHKGTLIVRLYRRDGCAVVAIADTGKGIPPEVRDKIFQPFFTTKPAGEGSGLGLDIVRKIIDRHGGRIEVDSEVGAGTTFSVVLPLQTAPIAQGVPA